MKNSEAKKKVEEFMEEEFNIKKGISGVQTRARKKECNITIVGMKDWETKQTVMEKKRLAGKRVYINHDLTGEERRIQKELRERARRERLEGREGKARYGKIHIECQWYRWNKEEDEIEKEEFFREKTRNQEGRNQKIKRSSRRE